jgi:hypothetical protein
MEAKYNCARFRECNGVPMCGSDDLSSRSCHPECSLVAEIPRRRAPRDDARITFIEVGPWRARCAPRPLCIKSNATLVIPSALARARDPMCRGERGWATTSLYSFGRPRRCTLFGRPHRCILLGDHVAILFWATTSLYSFGRPHRCILLGDHIGSPLLAARYSYGANRSMIH